MICSSEFEQLRKFSNHYQHKVAKNGLCLLSKTMLPISIQSIFFNLVQFEHSTVDKTRLEFSHFFLLSLEESFFENFKVRKLTDEPSAAFYVLIQVRFKQIYHLREIGFSIRPLQDCYIELSCKFEHFQLKLFYLRLKLLWKRHFFINRILNSVVFLIFNRLC